MDTVRVGVVGCGVMGSRHLETLSEMPTACVAAVADRIESRRDEAANKYAAQAFSEGAEMIATADDVDAVILAAPAADRAGLAVAALERGKHVLVEKPIAFNAGEVREMIAARGKLTAGCCSSRIRMHAHAQRATEFLAGDPLGPLRVVRARHVIACGPEPESPRPEWRLKVARNGGGILFNWGCYDLDYLLGLTGWQLRPRTVLAGWWTVPPQFTSHVAAGSDAETHYAALVHCDGGTVITLDRGEYMPAAGEASWEIVGTRGSVRLAALPGKEKTIWHDDTTTAEGLASRPLWQGDEDWGDARGAEIRDFVDAVREGRQPDTDLEKSLIVQKISDAIIASGDSGRAVEIE